MATATATKFERPIALAGSGRRRPERRDGLVARPRLVSRLIEEPAAALALIAAPAGYGKTSLIVEWAERDPRPFAWLTLDDSHDDPAFLVAALVAALDKVAPLDPRAEQTPAALPRALAPTLLRRLSRALDGRPPLVLVIDDAHRLHSSESLELLRAAVDGIPRGSTVALGSRTQPSLPLGRLRAHRVLTEIRAPDLAMTLSEAATLFWMAGVDLQVDQVQTLLRRAEGWPAGLYLAALSLRDQPDLADGIARFGGDDVVVAEYLRDEVLSQLRPDAAEFLARAAVVDRLSGPVCDAVLRRQDSARLLSEIGRDSLLLVPLDRKAESYRCAPLLAEMLEGQRRRLEPGGEADLHVRASAWYAANGDQERAIEHAIAAGDPTEAGRLIWASVPAYVMGGRNSAMQRWLSSFTPDQIAGDARLALAAAHSHLALGALDSVQRWTSSARRVLQETPPRKRTPAVVAGVAILRSVLAGDRLSEMGKEAARAYRLEPEDSPWRGLCCLLEGVSLHLGGEREAAESRLEEGARRAAVAAPSVQTLCLAQLALLAAEREDWEGGAARVARAKAQVAHYGLGDYPATALVFAASALVQTRRGSADHAHDDVRRAAPLLEKLADFVPWLDVEVRLALSHALLRTGDVAGARRLVAEAARSARRVDEPGVLQEWIADADREANAASEMAPDRLLALTAAELRILRFLPTHLSFREIAARLYVSGNTVKTQAHSVYRKLDASSRSEAVAHATARGLLEAKVASELSRGAEGPS